jgi:hypothetical protein
MLWGGGGNLPPVAGARCQKTVAGTRVKYAQTVWRPYKQKHKEVLEAVHRASKILPCMQKYNDRLKKLALPTLPYQRLGEI